MTMKKKNIKNTANELSPIPFNNNYDISQVIAKGNFREWWPPASWKHIVINLISPPEDAFGSMSIFKQSTADWISEFSFFFF